MARNPIKSRPLVPGVRLADETLRLYTAREAARVLGVHPSTVYAWLKDGTLQSTQRGGRHYIPRSALVALGGAP